MRLTANNPRYEARLPIRTSGQSSIEGELINISRTGAKIKLHTDKVRSVNSYLSFYVYLDNKIPETKSATPAIGRKRKTEQEQGRYIKLVSKVIRYANENGDDCLGIEIVPPEGVEKEKWEQYLATLEEEKQYLRESSTQNTNNKTNLGFTLRFSTIRDICDLLPSDPKEAFFIQTKKPRSPGAKVAIVLIHPDNKKKVEFEALIQTSGMNPQYNAFGVTCTFRLFNTLLRNKLNKFIGLPFYEN